MVAEIYKSAFCVCVSCRPGVQDGLALIEDMVMRPPPDLLEHIDAALDAMLLVANAAYWERLWVSSFD